MEHDPNNEFLRKKSYELLIEYNEAKRGRNILKGRKHEGIIMAVCDEFRNRYENEEVAEHFLKKNNFLGKHDKDDKASGPDEFTSKFFKEAWDIVGMDVCKAVQEFFVSGKLLGKIMECKLVLVDDDEKPLEKVDYPVNSNSDDEVEPIENETVNFLASKGVRYGLKSL
ncbi:hypothetical protein Tco_0945196 [Tanacetum coccineum]